MFLPSSFIKETDQLSFCKHFFRSRLFQVDSIMKKILLFFVMAAVSLPTFASEIDTDETDPTFIITECGKTVQIPHGKYTPEQIDELITIYTEALC